MPKAFGAVGAAVAFLGVLVAASFGSTEYVQTSCEIDNRSNYAVIWLQDSATVGMPHVHKYSIQFEPAGLTVRLPPTYYAPEWGDAEVVLEFPQKDATSGVLKLRSKGMLGSSVKTIGRVQRACWNAVRRYVTEHVQRKGVVAHMSEMITR
jgi:hypothetical protein